LKETLNKKNKKIVALTLVFFIIILFILTIISAFNFFLFDPISLDWLLESPIAHRGLHENEIPENSLAAFTNAITYGYIIELDVMLTKDNVPIIFHDKNTLRMTGEDYEVKDTNFTQLSSLKLDNSNEKIPTLEETLALVNKQVGLLIEIKSTTKQNLNAILTILESYDGNYALQFFNSLSCSWFSKKLPEIPVGMIYKDYKNIDAVPVLNLRDNICNLFIKPNFISYYYEYIEKMNLNKHREKGLIILGYTFTQSEITNPEYTNYFDNIIFDLSN